MYKYEVFGLYLSVFFHATLYLNILYTLHYSSLGNTVLFLQYNYLTADATL